MPIEAVLGKTARFQARRLLLNRVMNDVSHVFRRSAGRLLQLVALIALPAGLCAQLTVDTSSREQSRVFYNAIYPASENIGLGWTGNLATGNAGTTSDTFKSRVFLRINFFRAFAGVPGDVTNNPTWSAMDQAAALMMSANNNLDHSPPTSWRFYSSNGANAAGKSNLSLSNCGSDSISAYMEDPGNFNTPVGHRRWILFPQTQQMGTGDIPATGSYYAANALWTFDLNHYADERPPTRNDFVAWPPQGYLPYQLVYPRWSFSYPGADFSGAQVIMSRGGTSIPVRIESRTQGYGENTIVFVPNNLNPDAWAGPAKPATDTIFHVVVGNVRINNTPQYFSYDVISFDPAKAGPDTPALLINGPTTASASGTNLYSVAAQTLATGYQWKTGTRSPYTVMAGAENSAGVIARGGFKRDRTIRAKGNYSYQLTHPRFTESCLTLSDAIFCSAGTKLNFSSRLTYATRYETAQVEVSTDGGNQWNIIWAQSGSGSAGQKTFTLRSLSLGAYSGREINVRFRYAIRQGPAYTQTASGVGWYVDNIAFSGAEQIVNPVLSNVLPDPSFSFTPVAGRNYVMQVRSQVFGAYNTDWSPAKFITGQP